MPSEYFTKAVFILRIFWMGYRVDRKKTSIQKHMIKAFVTASWTKEKLGKMEIRIFKIEPYS